MKQSRKLAGALLAVGAVIFATPAITEPADKALPRCVAPPSGLAGWWPLDEAAGPTALELVDGNFGQHLGGPVPVQGVVDGALSFDGFDDRVVVPRDDLLDLGTGDFTIDAWVRTGANGVRTIVDKRAQPLHGYHFFLYNRRPGLQMAIGGTWMNWVAPGVVPPGVWTHVTVTVDRDDPQGIRFYVDGLPSGPGYDPTAFQGSLSSGSSLVLGRRSFQKRGFWDGELDEIEIFRGELSPYEVLSLALAGRAGKCKCAARGCSLIAWWPLDAALFTADDVAGHLSGPHDGEVVGSVAVTGRVASALRFDGVDDLVKVGQVSGLGVDLTKPGALSLAAWISTSQANGYRPIVSKTVPHPNDIGTIGYVLSLNDGKLGFSFTAIDSAAPFASFAGLSVSCQDPSCMSLADGAWHHVGATLEHDGGGQGVHGHLYADGRLVGVAGPVGLPLAGEGGSFLIGAELFHPSHFFEGRIDEVEVFDDALLEADFAALFGAGGEGICTEHRRIPCGSRGLPACPEDQFCDFGAGAGCGATDLGGTCELRPEACPLNVDPVCGCDGMTYPNECTAHQEGVSVAYPGPC